MNENGKRVLDDAGEEPRITEDEWNDFGLCSANLRKKLRKDFDGKKRLVGAKSTSSKSLKKKFKWKDGKSQPIITNYFGSRESNSQGILDNTS